MLSLVSFTLRPGPLTSQIAENANDTSTNSSNITATETMIFRSFQGSSLSEFVTNSLAAAFTSSLKSSLNMTQESLEKFQLQVTSNITSALKNILTLSDNEGILNIPDEAAIPTLWYTDSPQNISDYFMDVYNESIIDANSTTKTLIGNNGLPKSNDPDDWYVTVILM